MIAAVSGVNDSFSRQCHQGYLQQAAVSIIASEGGDMDDSFSGDSIDDSFGKRQHRWLWWVVASMITSAGIDIDDSIIGQWHQ